MSDWKQSICLQTSISLKKQPFKSNRVKADWKVYEKYAEHKKVYKDS